MGWYCSEDTSFLSNYNDWSWFQNKVGLKDESKVEKEADEEAEEKEEEDEV